MEKQRLLVDTCIRNLREYLGSAGNTRKYRKGRGYSAREATSAGERAVQLRAEIAIDFAGCENNPRSLQNEFENIKISSIN